MKRGGVPGHLGMKRAPGIRVVPALGPAIDRACPDLEVAALFGAFALASHTPIRLRP
jgi:hypothetical protein